MILGITGRALSGKDTVFQLIQKAVQTLPVERRAFADKLKDSVAAVLGITRADIERLKISEHTVFTILAKDTSLIPDSFHPMTMRTLLQRYGTEGHRDIFGPDFWVMATLPETEQYRGKLVVVTDVRFPNEAAWIRSLGGKVVAVQRLGHSVIAESGHASEQDLSDELIDFWLWNSGTLEELELGVRSMLRDFLELDVYVD